MKIAQIGWEKTSVEVSDGPDQYPSVRHDEEFRKFYRENGYVVARNLMSADQANQILDAFFTQVKPYEGPILRQHSFKKEQHRISPAGLMTNSILGIQDLTEPSLNSYKFAALEFLASEPFKSLIKALLGEAPKIVETMFFESNSATGTPPHADTHYMDSERQDLVGAWIALEDIPEDAGRFFVYPKSHHLGDRSSQFSSAFERYAEYEAKEKEKGRRFGSDNPLLNLKERQEGERLLMQILKDCGLICTAPALSKGDVVLWASKTVHGSIRPRDASKSRRSLNAHCVRESDLLVRHGEYIQPDTIEFRDTQFCLHVPNVNALKRAG